MAFLGDFLQGAADQLPVSIDKANQFEQKRQALAISEKANQIQEQSVQGMTKLREQQEVLNKANFIKTVSSLPPKGRSAALKFGVKNNLMTQDFADQYGALADEQIAFISSLVGKGEITPGDIGTAMSLGMTDIVTFLSAIENKRLDQQLKEAQTGKFRSETELNKFELQQTQGTANVLRGGQPQMSQPSGLPSISAALPGGGSTRQQQPPSGNVSPSSPPDTNVPISASGLESLSSSELEEAIALEMKKTQGQPLSSSEAIRDKRLDMEAKKRSSKLSTLVEEQARDMETLNQLFTRTDSLSSSKYKDLLSKVKFTEQKINQLGKGYPASIAKAIANDKAALMQIKRIEAKLNPEFTGIAQGREIHAIPLLGLGPDTGRKLPFFKKRSKEEFQFRSDVGLLKVQLRKHFFGSTQTKLELEGSLASIPDVTQVDEMFAAALETTKQNIIDNLNALEEAGQGSLSVGADEWEALHGGE